MTSVPPKMNTQYCSKLRLWISNDFNHQSISYIKVNYARACCHSMWPKLYFFTLKNLSEMLLIVVVSHDYTLMVLINLPWVNFRKPFHSMVLVSRSYCLPRQLFESDGLVIARLHTIPLLIKAHMKGNAFRSTITNVYGKMLNVHKEGKIHLAWIFNCHVE